jgi:hypothetical protein
VDEILCNLEAYRPHLSHVLSSRTGQQRGPEVEAGVGRPGAFDDSWAPAGHPAEDKGVRDNKVYKFTA